MKKYIAPEALTVALNSETRFALTISEGETGASGMESNKASYNEDWNDVEVETEL